MRHGVFLDLGRVWGCGDVRVLGIRDVLAVYLVMDFIVGLWEWCR